MQIRTKFWDRATLEGEGAGSGGGEGAGANGKAGEGNDNAGGSEPGKKEGDGFFDPNKKRADGEKAGDSGSGNKPGDRPEWLHEKYADPEAQAKGYDELHKAYVKKTDELREQVKGEVAEQLKADMAKELGVPDKPDGYEYPENWKAPPENVDNALREWAIQNNVGADAFQALLKDVWALTAPNEAEEMKKLGSEKEATARIDKANEFANEAFDETHHSVLSKIMTTAEGVTFMERIAALASEEGFAPSDNDRDTKPLTRESIRKMQADPKFGTDDDYTAEVRGLWKKFAQQQGAPG